jgi:hypothetical protein
MSQNEKRKCGVSRCSTKAIVLQEEVKLIMTMTRGDDDSVLPVEVRI